VDSLTISAPADNHAVLCGQLLDHYRIDYLAARGGMADVFRATDMRTGRIVALKIPHPELADDSVLMDSFAREEQILRKFDHPGIVRVIREPGRSRRSLVMEWVKGRLLRDILDEQNKLPADRAIRIALSLCDALEHIHRRDVVHRDLKPENIMVDGEDRATIIDFGIAQTRASRWLTFSAGSRAMGTPDYVSPEQVEGKRGDQRSDIYALGVIIYEMLSGELPFSGLNPLVVMNARLLSDPPAVRTVNTAISPQLEELIRRALQRDPKKRHASARDFASDLSNQLEVGTPRRSRTRQQSNQRLISKRIWLYLGLAMIPLLIFGLLLAEARREASSTDSSSRGHRSVVTQTEQSEIEYTSQHRAASATEICSSISFLIAQLALPWV
jgi:serine/threonine-protein kinase